MMSELNSSGRLLVIARVEVTASAVAIRHLFKLSELDGYLYLVRGEYFFQVKKGGNTDEGHMVLSVHTPGPPE